MTVYLCELCDYVTDHKTKYIRHTNTKKHIRNAEEQQKHEQQYMEKCNQQRNPCNPKRHHSTQKGNQRNPFTLNNTFSIDKKTTYDCKYCGKSYAYRQGRSRHQRKCPQSMELVENHPSKLANGSLDQTKTQISEMNMTNTNSHNSQHSHNTTNSHNTHNNTHNTHNNTTNHITINNYQTPDRSHLSDDDIMRIIKKCNSCVPKLVEETYFNKDKPENHSLCIRTLNNKYAFAHNGKQWNATMRDELVDRLIDLGNLFLENKLYDWSIPMKGTSAYENANKLFNRYMNNSEEDHVLDMIKNKITLILYNFRNLPKMKE